jgi:hypothetical protein
VQESRIGWAGELQWVAVVLEKHWVGDGKRRKRLSTVSRTAAEGSGGVLSGEEIEEVKFGLKSGYK